MQPVDTRSVTPPNPETFLTDFEVARQMGFGIRKVRRMMERGEIPGRRYGKSWMVSAALWQRYLHGEWNAEAA